MALVLQDRVSVNSTGSGTGNLALGSAYPGFRTFASCIPDGSIVYYTIANQAVGYDNEWEVGYGKYVLGTNTLVRNNGNSAETGVYSSSNSNAYVNFTAATNGLQIFITQPSEQAVYQEVDGSMKLIGGIIEVSLDGTESTTPLPNVAFQAFSTINSYMQSNMQNLANGTNSSADYVVTADQPYGTDTDNYIDLGFASSGYSYPEYAGTPALTGYVQCTANNGLVLQSGKYGANVAAANASATDIIFAAGDLLLSGHRGRIAGDTGNWIVGPYGTTDTGENFQVSGTAKFSNTVNTTLVYSSGDVANASNSTVLATKAYVDVTSTTGIQVHTPARAEAIGNLNATYSNGTGGVGATLTNAGTQAALVLDGITLSVNDRVLIADQTDQTQNGIYYVSNVGSGSTNWVLTRATDANSYGTGTNQKLAQGSYIYVQEGNTAAGESYLCTTTGTITFGSTNIVFTQFSASPAYVGTDPINVSGQTISLTGIVDTTHGGTNLSSYTTGDMLYASGTNVLGKRSIGSTDQVLLVNGGVPTWGSVALGSANGVSGTLPESHGGTNITTYTLGDIIYANATNTLAKLPGQITTTQKFLSQTGDGAASSAPSWSTVPVASITGLAPSATTDTSNASNITSGTLPTGRISGSYTGLTGVGTLTAGTWTANVIGASYGGTGVAGTITGIPYANGASAYTAATASDVVTLLGSTAVANATYAVSAGSAGSSTTATNLAGGAAGSIPYQSASGTTQMLATASGVLVGGSTPAYSTTPTLTGTNFSAIPNSALTNSAVTINGTSVSLGGSASVNLANSITFNNGGLGNASGVTFNGGSAPTISYNTIGAAPTAGSTNITSVGTLTAGTWNANTIAVAYGGTGQTSYTDGQLLIGNSTGGTLTKATLTAGTAISVTNGGGSITIANSGVTSAVAGTGVTVSGATGAVTFSIGQAVATSSNVQFNSLGVGTAGSATTGEIRATNNVTAYYSDERLKTKVGNIENALDKVKQIETMVYHANETAVGLGYDASVIEVGVTAQSVQKVMPQTVAPAPIDEKYMTVRYERLVPLLIEAIKELEAQVAELKAK